MVSEQPAGGDGANPRRDRPEIPDVPKKLTPAKVAGGGGIWVLILGILWLATHWGFWRAKEDQLPIFPSSEYSILTPAPTITPLPEITMPT